MADLTIKPQAGSGNKLIIQDQAGNARVTTSDAGIDIPAVTGNLTIAGDIVPSTPLSHRNMIINGGMQICQRATTTAPTPKGANDDGYFMADRWRLQSGGSTPARYNLIQVDSGLAGIPKAHQVDCTTASASPGSDDYIILTQRIEGFNCQQMEFGYSTAKLITLSFWAKGTAGTYVVELYDGSNSSAACQQFTVTTSWQRFTATFPARTTGTIDNDNTNGMEVNFWLHTGSWAGGGTYAANTWRTSTNANRAVGISNSGAGVAQSTSHEFFFTGVQLELGSNATPFEHRSYGEELLRCQRYYQKSYEADTEPGSNTNLGTIHAISWADGNVAGFRFAPRMRDVPSVRFWTNGGTLGQIVTQVGDRAAVASYPSETAVSYINVTSGTNTHHNKYHFDANAEL